MIYSYYFRRTNESRTMAGKKKKKPLSPWAVIREALGLRKKRKKKKRKHHTKPFDIFRALPLFLFKKSSSQKRHRNQMLITGESCTKGGQIIKWYSELKETKIRKIEVRKEHAITTFRHEFALAYLTDGTAYRFDRRPHKEPSMVIGDFLDGCKAEDSMTPVTASDLQELLQKTDFVVRVNFRSISKRPDIISVIYFTAFLCLNRHTKKYELGLHNCYFFARSIINFICSIRNKRVDDVRPSYLKKIARSTANLMLERAFHLFDAGKRIVRNF